MRKLSIPKHSFLQLVGGVQNAIVIDETNELLVNEPVEIWANDHSNEPVINFGLECSVNFIHTDKDLPGLRKNHALVGVSVIRHLTIDVLVNNK